MTSRSRARLCSLAVSLGLVLAVVAAVPAVAARGATTQMVALGDSYASGVGTRDYYKDSGSCERSPKAYAVLDSQRIGATLTFVACSGATTGDVEADQVGALSASTNDVTVTIGGNDIGFSDVITECALPSWASNCFGAIRHADTLITTVLPGRLDTLYGEIAGAAPQAKVVVVGYPRLFNGQDCNAGTFFTKAEETKLNASADLLDQTIEGRATAAGAAFVDPRAAFVGHAICDKAEWINGLSYPVSESFHPNVSGQAAYASLVAGHLSAS